MSTGRSCALGSASSPPSAPVPRCSSRQRKPRGFQRRCIRARSHHHSHEEPRSEDTIILDDLDGLVAANRGAVRLFLDTADTDLWKTYMPTGVWYGITTNPLILQRCGVKCNFETLKKLALDAHALGAEELQLQTWGESVEDMVGNGQLLGAMGVGDMEIVVKVPITARGLTAASRLIEEGVPITMTGVYAPHQVVAAAAVGASYAAPYLGRMNDAGRDGMVSCMQMQEIIDNAGSEMRLLVASVRNLREVTELAAHGCNTFTLGAAVAEAMYADPLTNAAAAEFEQCARDGGAYD